MVCEGILKAISQPMAVMGRRVLREGEQNYETFKVGRAGSDWKKRPMWLEHCDQTGGRGGQLGGARTFS